MGTDFLNLLPKPVSKGIFAAEKEIVKWDISGALDQDLVRFERCVNAEVCYVPVAYLSQLLFVKR